jgi:folate-dependent phosphoribosylglycinamide formyltransferase PurN
MKVFLLLPGALDQFQVNVLDRLFREPRLEVVGACVDTTSDPTKLQKVRRDLRMGRVGFVLVKAVSTLLGRRRHTVGHSADYLAPRNVPLLRTPSLYDRETLEFIRSSEPDCVFRAGYGIIREPVLTLAPKGVLSYHHGDIRRYRGMPVAFWELYNGERELGVTVQQLRPKLDAGPIVRELAVPIFPTDTWRSLERRAYAASEPLLVEACLLLDSPGFEPARVRDDELGPLFTEPDLRRWSVLQLRVAARKLRALRERRPDPYWLGPTRPERSQPAVQDADTVAEVEDGVDGSDARDEPERLAATPHARS